jgi:hypothetical protein
LLISKQNWLHSVLSYVVVQLLWRIGVGHHVLRFKKQNGALYWFLPKICGKLMRLSEGIDMNEPIHRKIWFPAKRYGWGWGLPITWQGWLVLIGYVLLIVAGRFWFLPEYHAATFVFYVLFLTVLFISICWFKGEPPKWRWGGK